MLGDVLHDDASYTGDTGESSLSAQYYRNKISEFQDVLNRLDSAYVLAVNTIGATGDTDLDFSLNAWIEDFNAKRWQLKATAEAINAAAAAINALGGRMGEISFPATLNRVGLAPIPLAAIAAAVAAAAVLISWGNTALNGLNVRLKNAQLLADATPEQKAAIIAAQLEADKIAAKQNGSTVGAIADTVKWLAIGAAIYFAWKAIQDTRG